MAPTRFPLFARPRMRLPLVSRHVYHPRSVVRPCTECRLHPLAPVVPFGRGLLDTIGLPPWWLTLAVYVTPCSPLRTRTWTMFDFHHGGCVSTAPLPPSDWLPDHVFVPPLGRRAVALARSINLGDGTDPCRAAARRCNVSYALTPASSTCPTLAWPCPCPWTPRDAPPTAPDLLHLTPSLTCRGYPPPSRTLAPPCSTYATSPCAMERTLSSTSPRPPHIMIHQTMHPRGARRTPPGRVTGVSTGTPRRC